MQNLNSQEYWENEILAFLALSEVNGIGYWTLRNLKKLEITLQSIFTIKKPDLEATLIKAECKMWKSIAENWETNKSDYLAKGLTLWKKLNAENVQIIFSEQDSFPNQLRKIPDRPYWLFVKGDLSVLRRKSIAVVGTRNPSKNGLLLASYFGALIEVIKVPIISGLADGIDQIIHETSVKSNIPTVAILGTGILSDYPASARSLRKSIVEKGGAVVTEYLPEEIYSAKNFVRRNRLQVALSKILVPIEWKLNSGTEHTINYALKYRIPVVGIKLANWDLPKTQQDEMKKLVKIFFTLPGEETSLVRYLVEAIDFEQTLSNQPSLFDRNKS